MLKTLCDEAARLLDSGYYDTSTTRICNVSSLYSSILSHKQNAIITEIKRASPSLGWIRPDIDVNSVISSMEKGGAAGISIITMPNYFHGDLTYLSQASSLTKLPILMKDFIISKKQIEAGWRLGADAILLIYKIFNNKYSEISLDDAIKNVHSLGMEVLLEVHGREELQDALNYDVKLIGINSRDLSTMQTNIDSLKQTINGINYKDKVLIAESGINNPKQLKELVKLGFRAFLIGTAIMKSQNIEETVRLFVGEEDECQS